MSPIVPLRLLLLEPRPGVARLAGRAGLLNPHFSQPDRFAIPFFAEILLGEGMRLARQLRVDEPFANREEREGDLIVDFELRHDVLEVLVHGLQADEKLSSDFLPLATIRRISSWRGVSVERPDRNVGDTASEGSETMLATSSQNT